MGLECPHCNHNVEFGWMDWEKHAIFHIQFTPAMVGLVANYKFREDESRASLCTCPKCKELVVYIVAECPISDITGDTQFYVCKPDDVKLVNQR